MKLPPDSERRIDIHCYEKLKEMNRTPSSDFLSNSLVSMCQQRICYPQGDLQEIDGVFDKSEL